VPFELSSILFLSAMVGAVVIGKREERLPAKPVQERALAVEPEIHS
jgi:hypothetical protein